MEDTPAGAPRGVWRGGWRGAAEDAWRLLGAGLLVAALFLLFMRLRIVVLPLFAGSLLATLVAPFADWQRRRGVPGGLAAATAVFGVVVAVMGITVGAISFAVSDIDRISDGVADSTDELTDWLVDGPLDLSRREVQESRENLGDEAGEAARDWARGGGLAKSTTTAVEVLAGSVLSVLVAFFTIKDHQQLSGWALGLWRADRREDVRAAANAAVEGLRGYLKGSLLLGLVEGTIIGGTVALLATPSLGAPIAVVTLIAAFFPVVGAMVAGVLAVLVTLAESGLVAAAVVAVVALVVQQLDNDVLAPVILGRTTQMHPLAVLVAITGGSALAGLAGAFVAVPLTAAVTGIVGTWRSAALADPAAEGSAPGTPPEGPASEEAAAAPGTPPEASPPA